MGNHVSHPTSTSVDALVSEVPGFSLERRLGSARFMKSFRGRMAGQPMVLKVFIKPDADFGIARHIRRGQAESQTLQNLGPGICPYSRVFETDKAVYVCRPYFNSNLYDRISTRPFLDILERKWIAFQLLSALAQIHRLKVVHGDIKTQNVMVTSWNGVYLTDFASHKPPTLPIDNPADFVYFFDASSRRTCYLAPERLASEDATSLDLNEAMDVFSMGCVLAEIFLEGQTLFSFAQFIKFVKDEYSPDDDLQSIEDPEIVAMVSSMIQRDPSRRPTAQQLLDQYRGTVFPDAFYTHMAAFLRGYNHPDTLTNVPALHQCPGDTPLSIGDRRILHVQAAAPSVPPSMALLVLDHVACLVRALTYPQTVLAAVDLLADLAVHVPDEHCLDRILPALTWILATDRLGCTPRTEAIKACAKLMATVQAVSADEARLFSDVLFPIFDQLVVDREPMVRATFATCLSDFAEASVRFMRSAQKKLEEEAGHDERAFLSLQNQDVVMAELQTRFLKQLETLILDKDKFVRRAILSDISRLCAFFGRQVAHDLILSHTITYLNDKDPNLRTAFFDSIAGVGSVIGEKSLKEYVIPLMTQSLLDADAVVVERVLYAFASLVSLKLLSKMLLRRVVQACAPYLLHPNVFLRYATVTFICACAHVSQPVEVACLIAPLLAPYLARKNGALLTAMDAGSLLRIALPPVRRSTLKLFGGPAIAPPAPPGSGHFPSLGRSPKPARPSPDEMDKAQLLRSVFHPVAQVTGPLTGRGDAYYQDGLVLQSVHALVRNIFLHPSFTELGSNSTSAPPPPPPVASPTARRERRAMSMIEAMRSSTVSVMPRSGSDAAMLVPSAVVPRRKASIVSTASESALVGLTPLKAAADTSTVHATVTASLSRAAAAATGKRPASAASLASNGATPAVTVVGQDAWVDKQYVGKNTFIRTLLATKSQEAFPSDLAKIGTPQPRAGTLTGTASVGASRISFNGSANGLGPSTATGLSSTMFTNWRPTGALVAHLMEHNGPVVQIAASADGSLLVSASDDGTVKVWDVHRVTKNLSVKPRASHHVGGRVRCVAFVHQAPYLVAVGTEAGSVQILAVGGTKSAAAAAVTNGDAVVGAPTSSASTIGVVAGNSGAPASSRGAVVAREIQLPDAVAGEAPLILVHYRSEVESVLLVATTQSLIYGHDPNGLAFTLTCPLAYGVISSMVVHDRAHWLLVGTLRGIMMLFDLRFRLLVTTWVHPSRSRIHAMTLHPTRPNHVVIAAGKNEVSVWDVPATKCMQVLTKQGHVVQPYQALAGPRPDDFIQNAARLFEETQAGEGFYAVVAPPGQDRVFAAGSDRAVRAWDVVKCAASVACGPMERDQLPSYSVVNVQGVSVVIETPAPQPKKESAGFTLRERRSSIAAHQDAITGVAVVAVGTQPMLATSSRDGSIKLWK
ncbi:Serine/threonine-protein kinase [Allomyces javanicus]|nr:Serine/threonine-protein kinase [Allomyces javanicus]